jgi:hypothetical protein
VLEESNIVVEQTFSESAGGSSVADGQFVSATGSSFRGFVCPACPPSFFFVVVLEPFIFSSLTAGGLRLCRGAACAV